MLICLPGPDLNRHDLNGRGILSVGIPLLVTSHCIQLLVVERFSFYAEPKRVTKEFQSGLVRPSNEIPLGAAAFQLRKLADFNDLETLLRGAPFQP